MTDGYPSCVRTITHSRTTITLPVRNFNAFRRTTETRNALNVIKINATKINVQINLKSSDFFSSGYYREKDEAI